MKNKLVILVGVLVLLGVGVFGYMKVNNQKSEENVEANNEMKSTEEQLQKENQKQVEESLKNKDEDIIGGAGNFVGKTISDVLNSDQSLVCRWRFESMEIEEDADFDNENEDLTGGVEEGIFYFSGNRFHYIVKINQNSSENTVDILSDGETVYQWSSLSNQGIKLKPDNIEEMGYVDYSKDYGWNCEKWNLDEKIFEVPSNIQFISPF